MSDPVQIHDLTCARCGEPLDEGDKFCHKCGEITAGAKRPPIWASVRFNLTNNLLFITLVVGTAFAAYYQAANRGGLSQTYATFIGLPLLIGSLTAYMTRPSEGLGMTVKITTIILCVVCPFLGEGAICILMAAPIFYAVAILGYYVVSGIAKLVTGGKRGPFTVVALIPLFAGAITHGSDGIRNPAVLTVTSDIRIAAPPEVVWDRLMNADLVSRDFPTFLRLGFPLPTRLERGPDGLTRLVFQPGPQKWTGSNEMLGRQIIDPTRKTLTFRIEDDGTMLSNWIRFEWVRFDVRPKAGGSSLVMTTRFHQTLQPGIYFNPLESFAVGQMHRYALENVKRLSMGGVTE